MLQYVALGRQLDLSSHAAVSADVIAHVRLGRGGSLLVAGMPGGGQARLLQGVEETALAEGRSVLRLAAMPGLPPLMFSLTLAEMLGADDPETSDPMDWTRTLRRALRSTESADQRLVVILHNIQHLATEDAAIVESLLSVAPPDPVLMVATAESRRADGSRWAGCPTFVDRARLDERCNLYELEGLRADDVALLIEERFGEGASSRRLNRELRRRAAGALDDVLDWIALIEAADPNIRLEILAASRSLATLPVPDRAFDRTATVLGTFADRGKLVACALAVLGVPATFEDIEMLTGLSRDDVADELEFAALRGLAERNESPSGVVRYQPSSGLVARSLYELTRPSLRVQFHERAVKLLQDVARPLGEDETITLGNHVLSAAPATGPRMMECVEASARLLVGRGAFGDARRQLLELDRLTASPDGQSALPDALVALLAETLSRSGDLEAASEVLRTRVDAASTDVHATIRRARDQVALGRDADGWRLYEPLVMSPNPSLDPTITRARIEAARVLQTLGMLDEALRQAALACEEAEQTENPDLAVRALTTRHTITLHAGRPAEALAYGREAYRLARRIADPAASARATAAVGNALADHSLRRGSRWTQRAIRLAEATDQFPIVSWAGIRLALAQIEQGDLAAAERTSLHIMHMDAGLHRLRPLPRSHALLRTVHALQGKHRDEASPAVQFWHGWETLDMAHALSQEAVARYCELTLEGDLRGAHDAISIVINQFIEVSGRGRFLLTDLLPRQVRAAVDLGDREAAEGSVARFDATFAQTEDFPLATAHHHLAHGQLDALAGRSEAATEHLQTAVERFGLGGYSWCQSDALQALARLYVAQGRPQDAAPCLDDAYTFLAGAGADLRPIRQLYRQVGRRVPRRQATGELSDREREVARLVARGMTDAEVAVELGIQRRTVTTHMHHILAKLGLHSRQRLQGRSL